MLFAACKNETTFKLNVKRKKIMRVIILFQSSDNLQPKSAQNNKRAVEKYQKTF
jgi:hypothetical protein